jgi:hypothetical protein
MLTNPDEIVKHEDACGETHHEDDKVNVILRADYDHSVSGYHGREGRYFNTLQVSIHEA